MEDSDGKKEDVSGSFSQAIESDSPKEAAGAEAEGTSSPSDGRANKFDTTPAPASEPDLQTDAHKKRGTFQKEGESGPTDMGAARDAARQTAAEGAAEVRLRYTQMADV